jgi:hypothetical protein
VYYRVLLLILQEHTVLVVHCRCCLASFAFSRAISMFTDLACCQSDCLALLASSRVVSVGTDCACVAFGELGGLALLAASLEFVMDTRFLFLALNAERPDAVVAAVSASVACLAGGAEQLVFADQAWVAGSAVSLGAFVRAWVAGSAVVFEVTVAAYGLSFAFPASVLDVSVGANADPAAWLAQIFSPPVDAFGRSFLCWRLAAGL